MGNFLHPFVKGRPIPNTIPSQPPAPKILNKAQTALCSGKDNTPFDRKLLKKLHEKDARKNV